MPDIGHTTSTAGTITVGGTTINTIDVSGDHDWFRVNLVAGQAIGSTGGHCDAPAFPRNTVRTFDERDGVCNGADSCRRAVREQLKYGADVEVRDGADDDLRGGHEVFLAFVRRQRRHISDERRAVRQPERRVRIDDGLFVHESDVDAVVHHLDPVARNAIVHQDRRNHPRCGDEDVHVTVLPP